MEVGRWTLPTTIIGSFDLLLNANFLAKGSRDPNNKTVWRGIAERWTRCAELIERQNSLAQNTSFHEASWQARACFGSLEF